MRNENLDKLLTIRKVLNEAIKSQRRADRCHQNYIEKTERDGFSRARTTTYNAAATSNAEALKSDMVQLKDAVQVVFNF